MTGSAPPVVMVPVAGTTVLNPRLRNRKVFMELVASIAAVGLKKPVTVRRREDGGYEVVCGQGRLEAFAELKQAEIPAFVTEASDEDCYLMSLVENLARRQHPPLELLREIEVLQAKGYSFAEMAEKTGLSVEYMYAICYLLKHGEHRLLKAMERGVVPPSIAMEIARAEDGEVQAALADAYENKTLPGNQIVAIRRIVEQRRTGKGEQRPPRDPALRAKPITGDSLVRDYKREMERQRQQVARAELAQNRLIFVVNAMRELFGDGHFEALVRAEELPTMPKLLLDRVKAGL